MKKLILYLKNENDMLREGRGNLGDNGPVRQEGKADNDNIINNLMDKVNQLEAEKERLQAGIRTLKEMSTLADKTPQDKQLWILKRTNAQLLEEKKGLEDRISHLQREILDKNLKIEELSKKLGVSYDFKPPAYTPAPLQAPAPRGDGGQGLNRGMTWTEKLKQVFT